jgi:hypothetical protein
MDPILAFVNVGWTALNRPIRANIVGALCWTTSISAPIAPCRLPAHRDRSGIEPAQPLSRVLIVQRADTARDGADMHVAEVVVPAVLAGFWVSTSGEFGGMPLFEALAGPATQIGYRWGIGASGSRCRRGDKVVGDDGIEPPTCPV